MIKYAVKVKYYWFYFDDAGEAVDFALTAKTHAGEEGYDVSIDFIDAECIEAEAVSEDD